MFGAFLALRPSVPSYQGKSVYKWMFASQSSALEDNPGLSAIGSNAVPYLARALAMNPEVLLYDEPTTGLDPIMSDVINELIIRTRQHYPVTSIVVTHDMRTALKVGDRIVMLYPVQRLNRDEAQIIFDGTPEEIEAAKDRRVSQFVRGEAGDRLTEMEVSAASSGGSG